MLLTRYPHPDAGTPFWILHIVLHLNTQAYIPKRRNKTLVLVFQSKTHLSLPEMNKCETFFKSSYQDKTEPYSLDPNTSPYPKGQQRRLKGVRKLTLLSLESKTHLTLLNTKSTTRWTNAGLFFKPSCHDSESWLKTNSNHYLCLMSPP